MQTFLPLPGFANSAAVLDYRRLGKMRVESLQILNTLKGLSKGWTNHPAVKMWRGYENALTLLHNSYICEWVARGYKNNMPLRVVTYPLHAPPFTTDPEFHRSHQSNLIRKDPVFYGPKFPGVPDNLPYIWPV